MGKASSKKKEMKQSMPVRRVKMYVTKPEAFMSFFKEGLELRQGFKISKGIPEDAVLVTVTHEPLRNAIVFVVQSNKFDAIPINEQPPIEYISIQLEEEHDKVPEGVVKKYTTTH